MAELPSGTITFLFTDIEGSTRLIQELPEHYEALFAAHDELVRRAIEQAGGTEVRTEGDSFFVVFTSASDAVQAAVDVQRSLSAHPWPDGHRIHVRMGLHTGEGTVSGSDYVGLDVHRAARIADAGHGGQVLLSDVTRSLAEPALTEGVTTRDLGKHTLKDLAMPEHLYQLVIPDHPADFPALRSEVETRHNLPVRPTSFIGRRREMEEVENLLQSSSLVTLTGIGGSGKTRLGLELAEELVDGYRDGVWFVDLAPIADPAVVRREVAAALGTVEPNLLPYLRERELLLVLDACDRVVQACSELAGEIIGAAEQVGVLATSWEPLAVPGEVVYAVAPLPVPAEDDGDLDSAVAAVELFVDRAKAADPGFSLTPENVAAVAQIVRRIDGIPLAIELAAARVNVLPPEQIVLRLEDRFRMLTGTRRTDAAHHQTLEAAISWGYELLSEQERLLFNRLCAFRGDFSLEAAEQAAAGDPIEEWAVLDLVSGLVSRALVVTAEPDVDGMARFRIYETLREFGRKRLMESDEADAVLQRHADFYLQLAETAEPDLTGPDQGLATTRLARDHDNIRAVLDWSLDSNRPEIALQLAGAIFWFWVWRGHIDEAGEWLERALAATDAATSPARARAVLASAGMATQRFSDPTLAIERTAEALRMYEELDDMAGAAAVARYRGQMAWVINDPEAALQASEEAVRLARLGNRPWIAAASLAVMADVARVRGDYDDAERFLAEGLAAAEESGFPLVRGLVFFAMGSLARDRGEYKLAASSYEEALVMLRQVGHSGLIGAALTSLGLIAWLQGDQTTARRLHAEALAEYKKRGTRSALVFGFKFAAVGQMEPDDLGIALDRYAHWATLPPEAAVASSLAESLRNLGRLARSQGRIDEATVMIGDSHHLAQEAGSQTQTVLSVAESAGLAVNHGQAERAAMLLGAAEAHIESYEVALRSVERVQLTEVRDSVVNELGADQLHGHGESGGAMTLAEAVALALNE